MFNNVQTINKFIYTNLAVNLVVEFCRIKSIFYNKLITLKIRDLTYLGHKS